MKCQLNHGELAKVKSGSHISGSTLLGVPVEIYSHGTQYWMFVIPATVVSSQPNTVGIYTIYVSKRTSNFRLHFR